MVLSRLTVCQKFDIMQPRWKDHVVLLKNSHIGTHNEITFRYAPTYPDKYYLSGDKARTFPIELMETKNGNKLTMRVVPLDDLEVLERA